MMVTIDHIVKFQIDPADASNEWSTLRYLRIGLNHLYEKVLKKEKPLKESDEKSGVWRAFWTTNPEFGVDDLVPSLFHWYSISLLNYARLVGFLSGLSLNKFTRFDLEDRKKLETITKYCDSYVNGIEELSAIKFYRDKIAAHFAITAPRKSDNPALLDLSVIYPVGYSFGRFRVGIYSLRRTDSAGEPHTGGFPHWSLTETHEALQARYNFERRTL